MEQTIEELEIVIRAKVDDAISKIKQVADAIKTQATNSIQPMQKISQETNNIANNTINATKRAVQEINKQTNNSANNIKNKFTSSANQVKSALQGINNEDLLDFEFDDETSYETQIEVMKQKLAELKDNYEILSKGEPFRGQREVLQGLLVDIEKTQNALNSLEKKEREIGDEGEKSSSRATNGFEGLWTSLKRGMLTLLGVHSLFALIKQGMSSAVQTNEELQATSNVTSNVIGQIFVPVMEKLQIALQYVIIGVARIIELFTKWDILSKVTTKNIDNTNKSAKALSKTLSGIDDIDTLSSGSEGGLGSSYLNDLKALNEFQERVKKVDEWLKNTGLITIFEKIKKVFDTFFKSGTWETMKKAGNWLLDHPDILLTIFGVILSGKLLSSIGNLLGVAGGKGLLGLIGNLQTLVGIGAVGITIGIAYKIYKEFGELSENMDYAYTEGQKFANEWTEGVVNGIEEGTMDGGKIANAINSSSINLDYMLNTKTGALERMKNVDGWLNGINSVLTRYELTNTEVSKLLKEHKLTNDELKTTKTSLVRQRDLLWQLRDQYEEGSNEWNIVNNYVKSTNKNIHEIDNQLGNTMSKFNNAMDTAKTKVKGIFTDTETGEASVEAGIKNIFSKFGTGVSGAKEGITTLFSKFGIDIYTTENKIDTATKKTANSIQTNVGSAITTSTTNLRDGFGRAFDTIKNQSANSLDVYTIKNKINDIHTSINNIFSKKKTIKVDAETSGLREKLGNVFNTLADKVKVSWGINLPKLPFFESGNVATSPTLGIFGEYSSARSNPEITAPQNILRQTFREELDSNNGSEEIGRITINLGSQQIFDEFIDYVNDKTERNGTSVFKEAY